MHFRTWTSVGKLQFFDVLAIDMAFLLDCSHWLFGLCLDGNDLLAMLSAVYFLSDVQCYVPCLADGVVSSLCYAFGSAAVLFLLCVSRSDGSFAVDLVLEDMMNGFHHRHCLTLCYELLLIPFLYWPLLPSIFYLCLFVNRSHRLL